MEYEVEMFKTILLKLYKICQNDSNNKLECLKSKSRFYSKYIKKKFIVTNFTEEEIKLLVKSKKDILSSLIEKSFENKENLEKLYDILDESAKVETNMLNSDDFNVKLKEFLEPIIKSLTPIDAEVKDVVSKTISNKSAGILYFVKNTLIKKFPSLRKCLKLIFGIIVFVMIVYLMPMVQGSFCGSNALGFMKMCFGDKYGEIVLNKIQKIPKINNKSSLRIFIENIPETISTLLCTIVNFIREISIKSFWNILDTLFVTISTTFYDSRHQMIFKIIEPYLTYYYIENVEDETEEEMNKLLQIDPLLESELANANESNISSIYNEKCKNNILIQCIVSIANMIFFVIGLVFDSLVVIVLCILERVYTGTKIVLKTLSMYFNLYKPFMELKDTVSSFFAQIRNTRKQNEEEHQRRLMECVNSIPPEYSNISEFILQKDINGNITINEDVLIDAQMEVCTMCSLDNSSSECNVECYNYGDIMIPVNLRRQTWWYQHDPLSEKRNKYIEEVTKYKEIISKNFCESGDMKECLKEAKLQLNNSYKDAVINRKKFEYNQQLYEKCPENDRDCVNKITEKINEHKSKFNNLTQREIFEDYLNSECGMDEICKKEKRYEFYVDYSDFSLK